MVDDKDKPLAFRSVDKLTSWRAAIPDRVSPALTLYVFEELFEPDELDARAADEELVEEPPESLRDCPG